MSKYSLGSFTKDQLINEFGLQDGSDVGSGFNADAGATDGNMTKSNKLLGEGYLTNEQYEKLKGSDKVRQAYSDLHGQEAAAKKFKDGYISINTMDALFDDLAADRVIEEAAPAVEVVEEPAIQYSPELGKALAYKKTFEENLLGAGRVGDYLFARDDSVQNDFNDAYNLNLERYRQPQTPEVLAEAQRKEDLLRAAQDSRNSFDEDIYQPKVFSNQYKLSIADRLKRSDDRKFYA